MRQPFPAMVALALLISPVLSSCKRAQAKTKQVGDKLRAFIIKDCEQGDRYCQVCSFGGKPTIMAIADIDDTAFDADLTEIQALLDQHAAYGLTAFAVLGTFKESQFVAPPNEEKALKALAAKKKALKLKFPLVVLPASLTEAEKKHYTPFSKSYEVSASRTLFFAGADNRIHVAEIIRPKESKDQFKALAAQVKTALARH